AFSACATHHSKQGAAADPRSCRSCCEVGLEHVRDQRSQNNQIDDVEEVASCDQRNDFDVRWRNLCLIERFPDKPLNCFTHGIASLSQFLDWVTQQASTG